MIDLEAITERDHDWSGEAAPLDCPEADRRALLEYIRELEQIAEETLSDLLAIKQLVSVPGVTSAVTKKPRRARKVGGKKRKDLSPPQWRMLEELSETNDNPENEWRFPVSRLMTGRRLVEFKLAKEHDFSLGNRYCFFSITVAGQERLEQRARMRTRFPK